MKMTLIEEMLLPLKEVVPHIRDADEKIRLELAIIAVRNSLDELFGDLFDAE
jgi:hypothetical protein